MFKVKGRVKQHLGRGRELGFPTANISVPSDLEEGIFVALVEIDGGKHPCLFFVGEALTFDEKEKRGEVYVLDFDGELYDKEIEVKALVKLRDNQRFESSEELVVQMRDDESRAREHFKNLNH